MAKTNAQKQADYRNRKSIRGLRQVLVYVPASKVKKLREYAASLIS